MSIEFAIIVKNKTRLETLIERFNTKAQAKFYIEHAGGNFEEYEIENETFHLSLSIIQRKLSKVLKNKIIERNFLPSFLFNQNQVVIVIGQDGLVANTAKYASEIPIIAVNPDTERYDGILLPFIADNFIEGVENVLANKYNSKIAMLAEARLNDGQRLLAFNDFFVGASSHISARYKISHNDKTENQSSSGIIISTKSGSTGWLSSIYNMSVGLNDFIEHSNKKKHKIIELKDDELMFAVREPFLSKKSQISVVAGIISKENKLTVESFMPTNGVLFSDGIETDYLHFNAGSIVNIGIAKEKANLVWK